MLSKPAHRITATTARHENLMRRSFLLICIGLLGGLGVAFGAAPAALADYPVDIHVVPPASTQPIMAPALVTAGNGTTWQVWIEPVGSSGKLSLSRFDPATGAWTDRRDFWSDPRLAATPEHTLRVVADERGPCAVGWTRTVSTGTQLMLSRRAENGAHWLPPVEIPTIDAPITPAALARGSDGRLLVAWNEFRDGDQPVLRAQFMGSSAGPASVSQETAADIAPDAAVFPDGSALLAFRGRSDDDLCTMRIVSWADGAWQPARTLGADHRLDVATACGPRFATYGGQVAVAWLATVEGKSGLFVSTSPDAGGRFTLPRRIDAGQPRGQPAMQMLRDGSVLVLWSEAGDLPGLYLRHLPPRRDPHPAVRLAISPGNHPGPVALSLLKDYDTKPAQILVTHAPAGATPSGQTLLVTLPDLSTLAGRAPCLPCDEADANATRGYAVKGRITAVQAGQGIVVLEHPGIPGVMRAAALPCRVDPALLGSLSAGTDVLGRIERRGRDWWLFNVKLLGAPIRG